MYSAGQSFPDASSSGAGKGLSAIGPPGPFSSSILHLANTCNVGQDTPGPWIMAILSGQTSHGSSPDAPMN